MALYLFTEALSLNYHLFWIVESWKNFRLRNFLPLDTFRSECKYCKIVFQCLRVYIFYRGVVWRVLHFYRTLKYLVGDIILLYVKDIVAHSKLVFIVRISNDKNMLLMLNIFFCLLTLLKCPYPRMELKSAFLCIFM